MSADLSTLFDVGGIIGAITAGVISDYTGMSATTCVGMLAAAAPMVIIITITKFAIYYFVFFFVCRCLSINILVQSV